MEKTYLKYNFHITDEDRYLLLARLSMLGFDGFEETEEGWQAYWPASQPANDIEKELNALTQTLAFTYFTEETPGQNWNALWEASFQPIRVGTFCSVRADFHPPMPEVSHEIIINPKMAFGTGHHATTYMMLAAMQNLSMSGKKILDYGCGTGILAILAAKLGSAPIDAVDIEWEAYENTLENCQSNRAGAVKVYHGTLDQVIAKDYEIILANINRNVILNSMSALYDKLLPDGLLLVSGILVEDRELILSTAQKHHFQFLEIHERTGWLSILFKKA